MVSSGPSLCQPESTVILVFKVSAYRSTESTGNERFKYYQSCVILCLNEKLVFHSTPAESLRMGDCHGCFRYRNSCVSLQKNKISKSIPTEES